MRCVGNAGRYEGENEMNYMELDTPSLLIDRERLSDNLKHMQDFADAHGVKLRPHTKTHKMPKIAKMQMDAGACGIAVAKIGEAEAMAEAGLSDIFIANEIMGEQKFRRIAELSRRVEISFGVDTPCQVEQADKVFTEAGCDAEVVIEIEVGEMRSGIVDDEGFTALLESIRQAKHVDFKGLFSHDGNTYGAKDLDECLSLSIGAQKRTLHFRDIAKDMGMPAKVVSYGATPTFMNGVDILPGITELRPGTYALMDAAQGHAIGTLSRCAATVLATVISRPASDRTILDAGAKALTKEQRKGGICDTPGFGTFLEYPDVVITKLFDEHTIVIDKAFHDQVKVGDKLRIIPVHICPVCNLYDEAYLISEGEVVERLDVACRGKIQ